MADLNEPAVALFINTQVRPIAEAMRALAVRCVQENIRYNELQAAGHFSKNDDTLIDGRAAEGVSVLTVNDVILLQSQIQTFLAQMAGGGVAEVIGKPCVRAIDVS